jgi:cytidylate kinase
MAINHNKATVHIASPYDDLILQLNIKLNKTYIAYGKYGNDKIAMQAEQDTNASGYSKANAVSRTVSKSSHLYKNTTWDLVDAVKEKKVAIEDLEKDALPEALKNKSIASIKTYVANMQKERNSIQKEIQELNKKRRIYVSERQSKTTNSLENAMTKAIKTQAKKKKYTW